MKDAIQKAIEGGYAYHKSRANMKDAINAKPAKTFLDPLFWQALGKQQGWSETSRSSNEYDLPDWWNHWHRFIDHLAEGKEIDLFFKTLLK